MVHLKCVPWAVNFLSGAVTSEYVSPGPILMKGAHNWTVCRKLFTAALSSGACHDLIVYTLLGLGPWH